jgi:hypothetical protein
MFGKTKDLSEDQARLAPAADGFVPGNADNEWVPVDEVV